VTIPVPKFSEKTRTDVEFTEWIRAMLNFDELDTVTVKFLDKGDTIYVVLPSAYDYSEMDIITFEVHQVDFENSIIDLIRIKDPSRCVISFTFDSLSMRSGRFTKNMARAFQHYRKAVDYMKMVENTIQLYKSEEDDEDNWLKEAGDKWL
jgi:hypothetical protein